MFPLTELAPITPFGKDGPTKEWDFVQRARVTVQMSAVTRSRPAFNPGWKATIQIQVAMPQYIPPAMLHQVITEAGQLVGVADFRPTYGRFQVTSFKVVS